MEIFSKIILTLTIIFTLFRGNICAKIINADKFIDDELLLDDINPVDLEIDCKKLCNNLDKPPKLEFTLFTKSNPTNGQIIETLNSTSVSGSYFNRRNPTRFIAHGWNSGPTAAVNTLLIEAYLQKGQFNIFVVDWTDCAKTINYFQARCCVKNVGLQIAKFIDFLNAKHKLKFNQISLIGHSLGAHCMGHAGKNVKNGQIHTIIGLDPAKPCFISDNTDDRLADSDAEYVEIIHTNADMLGFLHPIGKASFYPNGGKYQNGCGIGNTCSHGRSYRYFAESIINNNFIPIKCKNFQEFLNSNCNITVSNNVKMGGEPSNNGKAEGIYYLLTNKEEPFGIDTSSNKIY